MLKRNYAATKQFTNEVRGIKSAELKQTGVGSLIGRLSFWREVGKTYCILEAASLRDIFAISVHHSALSQRVISRKPPVHPNAGKEYLLIFVLLVFAFYASSADECSYIFLCQICWFIFVPHHQLEHCCRCFSEVFTCTIFLQSSQ